MKQHFVEEPVSDVSMASLGKSDLVSAEAVPLPEAVPVKEGVERCSTSPKKHNTRFSANVQKRKLGARA